MSLNLNEPPLKIIVETTLDGSPTLYRPDIDEHYHSVKGAVAESRHVYLDLGLRHFLRTSSENLEVSTNTPARIFEIGFGTGLNAALTLINSDVPIDYYSVELNPVTLQMIDSYALNTTENLKEALYRVNLCEWNRPVSLSEIFRLNKIEGDLKKITIPTQIDVVYFDAFAPDKQPELWTEEIFRKIFVAMNCGGVLTTYCAKGAIRRLLEKIGFKVERLPGPPGGKREVLRSLKVL